MTPDQLAKYKDLAVQTTMLYAPQLLLALTTLFIGMWAIRKVVLLVDKGLQVRHVDPTLAPFLKSLVGWILRVVLVLSVASMVGIQTTSFVAILGAAGLAVGLALQGSLSNFAGGVLILIFRPYRVGDSITAQGVTGTVKEIQIFTTIVLNAQNRRVIIPNGAIANGIIMNLTSEPHVRVDTVITIPYTADLKKAKETLLALAATIPGALEEPAPAVIVSALGTPNAPAAAAVHLVVQIHTKPADASGISAALFEAAKYKLDAEGVALT